MAFYRRLAQELRRRNLRLFVGATTTFRAPVFASLPVDYTGLTLQRYVQEKRQMVEVIVREIRPDYLSLENEPGTQEKNTGLPFTVQNVTAIMQHLLAGLDRQGVLIGAGAGSWDDLAYIENLAQQVAIDFVDFHVYPINRDYLVDRAFRIADIARRHNKRVAVGEAWLYKARDQELGGTIAQAADIFARDVYGFWMRHFFAYVDYNDATRRMRPARLFDLANREVARSMLADPPVFTQTGLAFQRLAVGGAR